MIFVKIIVVVLSTLEEFLNESTNPREAIETLYQGKSGPVTQRSERESNPVTLENKATTLATSQRRNSNIL